eukprot:4141206-Prymnesium_polylepis.1
MLGRLDTPVIISRVVSGGKRDGAADKAGNAGRRRPRRVPRLARGQTRIWDNIKIWKYTGGFEVHNPTLITYALPSPPPGRSSSPPVPRVD